MKISLTAKPGTSSQIKTGNWRESHYPEIDHEKCIGCSLCEQVCPEGICFKVGEKNKAGKFFYEKDLDWCKGCGICAQVCPVKAITIREEEK